MNNSELRDKLLELEPYPEDLRNRIREEILHTKERPLKTWERPLLVLLCVFMVMAFVGGAIAFATYYNLIMSKTPIYTLILVVVMTVFACIVIVLSLQGLKRGTWRLWDDSFMVYGVAGIICCHYIAETFGEIISGGRLPTIVGAYIIVAVMVIWMRIETAETRLREHVLRNELAVAKLAELITARNAVDPKIEPTP